MGTEPLLLTLARLAYTAAASPQGWTPFLEAYARALDGAVATLLSWRSDSKGSTLRVTAGSHASPELVREYNAHYGACNPWLLHVSPYMRTGAITLSHVTYPVSQLVKSEFYNDFLIRHDIWCGIGACLLEHDGVYAHLSMQRPLKAGLCDAQEVTFVGQLVPHLQRAVQLHARLEGLRIDHQTDAGALDTISAGVLIVSADSRVRLANRQASQLLARNDGLSARSGELRASTPALTKALHGLIARTARTALGETSDGGGAMRVQRPSQRPALSLLAVPMVPELSYPPVPPGCVTLIIREPSAPSDVRSILKALYGLTEAQARFAECIVSGQTTRLAAETLAIGRETARTHLKAILRKSQTHRQAEFVRTVALGLAGHVQGPLSGSSGTSGQRADGSRRAT